MLPTLVVDWQASVLRDEKAGCFREVAGLSIAQQTVILTSLA